MSMQFPSSSLPPTTSSVCNDNEPKSRFWNQIRPGLNSTGSWHDPTDPGHFVWDTGQDCPVDLASSGQLDPAGPRGLNSPRQSGSQSTRRRGSGDVVENKDSTRCAVFL
ncbi:uncharacterized protein V6R79_006965 [Siganus canaliculatus]